MNDDLKELLTLLNSHRVEYLVIEAHAVAFYGRPRMTEDVDLLVGKRVENSLKMEAALKAFGAPIGDSGAARFSEQERPMIRIGVPPNQDDILNFGGSKEFAHVWERRVSGWLNGVPVCFPSKVDLIEMKQVSGRAQDLADIERLNQK